MKNNGERGSLITNPPILDEQGEKKDEHFFVRVGICAFVVLLLMTVMCTIYAYSEDPLDSDVWKVSYDEGWTVAFEGHTDTDVNISEYRLPRTLDTNDTVTISNVIPEDMNAFQYESAVIRVDSRNSVIKAFVDGEERYSYGEERYLQGKMVGSGIHYVNLQPDDAGKVLSITYLATERQAFSSFDNMDIYNAAKGYQYELVKGKVPFTSSLLLIMLGFCIMLIAAIASVKETKFLELFWVGGISAFIGTWSLCYYGYVQMFNVPVYVSSIVEYIALYFFAFPMLLYFKSYVDATLSQKAQVIYRLLIMIQIGMDVILTILQVQGWMHYPTALPTMHMLMAAEMLFVVVILIMNVKKGDASSKTILAGTIAMVSMIVLEYVLYTIRKYTGVRVTNMEGFAAIGTLVFIFAMITAFAIQIAARMKVAAEKSALYRMAYTDELTQLYNRRYCEQKLKSLTHDHMDYGIINFDLNGLKGINDTQGHNMGDVLISGFADILKRTFGGVGTVGRMGGDEFIVIVEGLDGFRYEDYIHKLMDNIQKANRDENRFGYSTSYGYANSREIDEENQGTSVDSSQVYKLADNRMYEYKRDFKKQSES